MLIVHSDQKKLHFIPPGSINTMYCILDPGTAHNQESVPSDLPEQCKPSPAYCKCILSPCTRHTIYCERIGYSIRSHRTVNNASHLLHTASAYCILHIQHLTPQLMLQIHLRPSIHFTKLLRRFRRRTFTQNILSNVTLYFGFVNCICHQLFGVVCSQGNLSNLGGLFLFYFTGV